MFLVESPHFDYVLTMWHWAVARVVAMKSIRGTEQSATRVLALGFEKMEKSVDLLQYKNIILFFFYREMQRNEAFPLQIH